MKLLRRYLYSSIIAVSIAAFAATALAVGIDKVVGQEGPSLPEEASSKATEALQKNAERKESKQEEEGEGTEAQGEGADGTNHGHCVSYWAKAANAADLRGPERGKFISSIAEDGTAVSAKVGEGGSPDATCDFADELEAARSAQTSSENARGNSNERGRSGDSKGKGKGLSEN